jgi:TPR repeat protein
MKSRMSLVLLMVIGCRISTLAQQPPPTLEQIKIAADAGDPVAQDKLAETYIMRSDTAHAEMLYRKAAAQDYVHAEGQLGNMLLMRSRMLDWETGSTLPPDCCGGLFGFINAAILCA